MKSEVIAIAALGRNRVLGRGNELLWHIPDDLKRFKALTLGHPVIMGRKTFDSIVKHLGRPLPGRTNIVVSRTAHDDASVDGVVYATSVADAIAMGKEKDHQVFIIGGAQIYEAALPYTDKLYLTLIDDEKDGDVYFPEYESVFTNVADEENRESNGLKYTWVTCEKY